MRKAILLWPAMFVFAAATAAQGPKTYFVDASGDDRAGDGSAAKPWRSITHAAARVPDEGVHIVVRPGEYNGVVRIARKFSRPMVVRAEKQYRTRLRHTHAVVHIYDAANVEFAGFDIARVPPQGTPTPLLMHLARASSITLRGNIIHDSFNNDLIKVNEGVSQLLITENIFYNQQGGAGQHLDINGCREVFIVRNIFFNDFGRAQFDGSDTHGFIVVKNSSELPESRRTHIAGDIFLNFKGGRGSNFILLGEDAKPVHEAQEVVIENNLMIGNSPVRMRAPFGSKGAREIVFRNNTITGDLPASAYAMRVNRDTPKIQPNWNLLFANNVWSDPTGTMMNFSDGNPGDFAGLRMAGNAYWNGGKNLPGGENVNPWDDPHAIKGDSRLPWPSTVVLPHWNVRSFWSTASTFGQEFHRLVREFGTPGQGSSLVNAGNAANSPAIDILGAPRGPKPDVGAVERGATPPAVRVLVIPSRILGGAASVISRVALAEPAPAGGIAVRLSATGPAVVPPEVYIPAGEDSASFSIQTKPVQADAAATISAVAGGHRGQASLVVVPQGVVTVNPSRFTVWAGESEHLAMLEGPAAPGTSLDLSASPAGLVSFPNVDIVPGRSYAKFTMRVDPLQQDTRVTVTAGMRTRKNSASILVRAGQAITGLTLDRTHTFNGTTANATVRIAEPALPGEETVVQLSSGNPQALMVPSTIRIPAGQLSATFPVQTKPIRGKQTAIGLTASLNKTKDTKWLVIGETVLTAVYPYAPQGGRSTVFVRVNAPAPANFECSIVSSRPDMASVPPTVVVPEKSYGGAVVATIHPGFDAHAVTVSVTCNGVTKTGSWTK